MIAWFGKVLSQVWQILGILNWGKLSITSKFRAAFCVLMLLMLQVAFLSFRSLNAVREQTQLAIINGIEIQRLVLDMDGYLQEARRQERDFFLYWLSVGFLNAREDYLEAHQQQINRVFAISNQLEKLLNTDNITEEMRRQSYLDLVTYRQMVEGYSRSFKEAVSLVGNLGLDDAGVLARLERKSAMLQNILQLSNDGKLLEIYEKMQAFENDYLLTRKPVDLESVSEAVMALKNSISKSKFLDLMQQKKAFEYLQEYESLSKEVQNIETEIYGKLRTFDQQARQVSGKLVSLSQNEVNQANERIETVSYWATIQLMVSVIAAFIVALAIANVLTTALNTLAEEQEKSEKLLLNILPKAIADRLKKGSNTIADHFEEVTVLFADIVGFTELSSRIAPAELVGWLNAIFSEFDYLAEKHGLEKIKTIGDAYMVVAGLPNLRPDHAPAVAEMALDMLEAIANFNKESKEELFNIRIGINTGPVVAGVIGKKKFIYDLWGDTVNTASRMESHGIAGFIQVAEITYKHLQDKYLFEERGEIMIKGKGQMMTYLLKGRKVLDSQQFEMRK